MNDIPLSGVPLRLFRFRLANLFVVAKKLEMSQLLDIPEPLRIFRAD